MALQARNGLARQRLAWMGAAGSVRKGQDWIGRDGYGQARQARMRKK